MGLLDAGRHLWCLTEAKLRCETCGLLGGWKRRRQRQRQRLRTAPTEASVRRWSPSRVVGDPEGDPPISCRIAGRGSHEPPVCGWRSTGTSDQAGTGETGGKQAAHREGCSEDGNLQAGLPLDVARAARRVQRENCEQEVEAGRRLMRHNCCTQ